MEEQPIKEIVKRRARNVKTRGTVAVKKRGTALKEDINEILLIYSSIN